MSCGGGGSVDVSSTLLFVVRVFFVVLCVISVLSLLFSLCMNELNLNL